MGATIAKIVLAMLGVIAGYNLLNSGNSKGIIDSSAKGSVNVIAALEGKR